MTLRERHGNVYVVPEGVDIASIPDDQWVSVKMEMTHIFMYALCGCGRVFSAHGDKAVKAEQARMNAHKCSLRLTERGGEDG